MTEVLIEEVQLAKLDGKVAIVTGGSSGIGKAIVQLLSRRGVNVAFGDTNQEAGELFQKSLESAGFKTHFFSVDVTNWDNLVSFFAAVKQKHGRIDFVFANAGVGEQNAVFVDILGPDNLLAAPDLTVLDVNLKGVIYTTKLALHYLKSNNQPGGGLVMTGSTSSYNERPNLPLYSTAKHGIVGLMRAVRHSAPQDNINVGLIAPGGTISRLFTDQAAMAFRAQGAPVNDASSVALAAVYLASNKETNGQALTIIGDKFIEVEGSILRTQPLWFGEYNTDMSRRVAGVKFDNRSR